MLESADSEVELTDSNADSSVNPAKNGVWAQALKTTILSSYHAARMQMQTLKEIPPNFRVDHII